MYPTLYDAFLDIFGLDIPALKIVMTFGFFVALAFLAAHWAMTSELKRKEANGEIYAIEREERPVNPILEYLSSFLIGFLLGFKVIYMILHFSEISGNPQAFILSLEGSWLWGALLGTAFLVYKYLLLKKMPEREAGQKTIFHPYQMMGNMTIIAAVSGFIGAKLFHHMETWSEFIQDPIGALSEPFSGLTFFGGLICGGAAVLWYANKHGVKWRTMLDIGAPAMMLAYGIGRMGCHFSGDGDWGTENLSPKPGWLNWLPDWAWAYDYPNNVLGVILENPVWPTPMYEVIMALTLFLILWKIRTKMKTTGVLFGIYLIFSGVERYLIEKIRVNPDYHFAGLAFTQAEMISVLFVLTGAIGIYILWKKDHKRIK